MRHMTSTWTRTLSAAFLCSIMLWSSACGEKAAPPAPTLLDFPIKFTAIDTEDNGIAKVPVLIDGNPVGFTDKDGIFKATINDKPGKEILLALGSIKGYEHTGAGAVVKDKLTATRTPKGIQTFPINVESVMQSTEVDTLIWVSAKCDKDFDQKACRNLEVQVNGEIVSSTDPSGRAHFTYTSPPGEKLVIRINTPTYSSDQEDSFSYSPSKPEYKLEVGTSAQVFVIDETFSDALAGAEKKVKKKRKRTTRRPTRRPVRRPKRRKKKKVKDIGISIF